MGDELMIEISALVRLDFRWTSVWKTCIMHKKYVNTEQKKLNLRVYLKVFIKCSFINGINLIIFGKQVMLYNIKMKLLFACEWNLNYV